MVNQYQISAGKVSCFFIRRLYALDIFIFIIFRKNIMVIFAMHLHTLLLRSTPLCFDHQSLQPAYHSSSSPSSTHSPLRWPASSPSHDLSRRTASISLPHSTDSSSQESQPLSSSMLPHHSRPPGRPMSSPSPGASRASSPPWTPSSSTCSPTTRSALCYMNF
jgi:hypothetical protein